MAVDIAELSSGIWRIAVDDSLPMFVALEEDYAVLYGAHNPVDATDVGRIARAFRKVQPKLKLRLKMLPTEFTVLNEQVSWHPLLDCFNELLLRGLIAIGMGRHEARSMDMGGMGSEYRGFLWTVSEYAERYAVELSKRYPQAFKMPQEESEKGRIAQELSFSTRSVAFVMRYGYDTLPYTVATGAVSLSLCIDKAKPCFRPSRGQ